MNKRKFLSVTVASLFTCLFLAFGWIYFYGLTSNPNKTTDSDKEDARELFKNVAVGSVVLQRFKNQQVWIVHLSSKQRTQTKLLNQFVVEPAVGCDLNKVYCVLAAASSRDGVYLQYTLQEPPKLLVGTPWFGGFVDPASGTIYDLVGRTYKQNKDKSVVSIKRVSVD